MNHFYEASPGGGRCKEVRGIMQKNIIIAGRLARWLALGLLSAPTSCVHPSPRLCPQAAAITAKAPHRCFCCFILFSLFLLFLFLFLFFLYYHPRLSPGCPCVCSCIPSSLTHHISAPLASRQISYFIVSSFVLWKFLRYSSIFISFFSICFSTCFWFLDYKKEKVGKITPFLRSCRSP